MKMSRGLGRIQKLILEILEKEKNYRGHGWYDVGSLTYQVIYGINYWNLEHRDGNPTESEKQSVYRAVRRLESLGHIESRIRTHPQKIHKDTKTKEIRKIKV